MQSNPQMQQQPIQTAGTTPPPPTTTTSNAMDEFRAGLTALLRSWSALRTAVEQDWGGYDTYQKAEDLRHNILTQFDGSSPTPKMTIDELEDNLVFYMEEEFSVVLEDKSERQVAETIWKMYEECGRGEFGAVRRVVKNAMEKEAMEKGQKVVVQTEGEMDEDSDDEDDEAVMAVDMDAMASSKEQQQQQDGTVTIFHDALSYASAPVFGGNPAASKPVKNAPPPRQLGEAAPEKAAPEVDEDGFATVAPRRRGRR